jgi:hypothetical protein
VNGGEEMKNEVDGKVEGTRGIEEGEKRKIKEHFSPFFFHLFPFSQMHLSHIICKTVL